MPLAEDTTRLVVLLSGNGSNFQAIIDACSSGKLPSTQIVRAFCNRKQAYGFERAKQAQIPCTYHNILPFKKQFPEDSDAARRAFDDELATLILQEKPHLVVCAGWMMVFTDVFVEKMNQGAVPVINLHPSLPGPDVIKGAGAIERAYEAFQRNEITKTGCMIHYVVEEVDSGECLVHRQVPIHQDDSLHNLETRIHEQEWIIIIEGIALALKNVGR